LIALALAGLILATMAQGLSLAMEGGRTEARALARRNELEAVERTLRSLMERMDPGGVSGRSPAFTGEAHAVAFTTTLPSTAFGQITRLADVRVALDPRHRLVVSWSPHLPNLINPVSLASQAVLLDGVDRLEIGYWQPGNDVRGGSWLARWTGRDVPRLIRIRIVPQSAGGTFPDIIAGPARDRWRS
jgi:general secretion pathway protein J